MKKRLLITSIVMMLVCAVALSTATYAWFTSNTSVTASSITMTAATSDSSALGIGWIGSSTYLGASTSITAAAPSDTFKPMVPKELAADSTTVGAVNDPATEGVDESATNIIFKGGTIKQQGGNFVFNNDVAVLTPYTFSNSDSELKTAFYVKNLSNSNSIANLKLTLDWDATEKYTNVTAGGFKSGVTYYTESEGVYTEATGLEAFAEGTQYYTQDVKNDNLIRVAVFARDAAVRTSTVVTTPYTLLGVLGKSDQLVTEWGDVLSGGNVEQLCTLGNEVPCVTEINFGTLLANQQIDMVVMVWLDGVALNDNTAGSYSKFGLNFAAAAPTAQP